MADLMSVAADASSTAYFPVKRATGRSCLPRRLVEDVDGRVGILDAIEAHMCVQAGRKPCVVCNHQELAKRGLVARLHQDLLAWQSGM